MKLRENTERRNTMFLTQTDEKVMRKICFYKLINTHISVYILYLYPSNHYIHIYNVYNNSYYAIILLSIFYIYHILFSGYVLSCYKNADNSRPANDSIHNHITKPFETRLKTSSNMSNKLNNCIIAFYTFLSNIFIDNRFIAQIQAMIRNLAFFHGFKMSLSRLQNQFLNTVKQINNI